LHTAWVKSGKARSEHIPSGLPPIVLQKSPSSLCEIEICNDRIGARAPLNRCCAFAPDLNQCCATKCSKYFCNTIPPRADIVDAFWHFRFVPKTGREQVQQPRLRKQRYSITSSARSRIDVGMSMPMARAVLRLTIVVNFVARSTGRSAGFAPLRILSMKTAARRSISGKFIP
jgi:hypothetical protein